MTFAWYQSLTTIPKDIQEATQINKLNRWQRFRSLEFPFGTISFIWNSMMSWAGGWFFLMAAEIFTVGDKDFRLPGLGSFLHEASDKGNYPAIMWGVATLILIIVILDQVIWRPLLAWSDKFKFEMTTGDDPPGSWFYSVLVKSNIIYSIKENFLSPVGKKIDLFFARRSKPVVQIEQTRGSEIASKIVIYLIVGVILVGLVGAGIMLVEVSLADWMEILLGVFETFLRVCAALLIAFMWTIPVGVLIATNKKVARFLQPMVQIFASIPATALFPVVLMFVIALPFGVNLASILLMLMGTQWYLLFNIIAGASAIPQDLKYTSRLLHLGVVKKWKTLILPPLFPYLITGAIAAGGGAWNASVVAEFVTFSGNTVSTVGIGSSIAKATADGNFPKLLASTLVMILTVVLINRFFWRRLYHLAEDRFKLE